MELAPFLIVGATCLISGSLRLKEGTEVYILLDFSFPPRGDWA